MAKYILILKNKRKGTLTNELLQGHVDHLKKHSINGNIFLAGPFKDNDGAIQIIEAASRTAAESIVKKDPFVSEKYYQTYELNELIEANEENNWLLEDSQTKGNIEK
ncbi:Uncharacterized conserved protein YciI, contains a putative active-site phosphohistidine [Tangfeifania diversioriginum]|uniref:Uncharacterized conserved protein YciI, contains a putative active-site phosphohistidine n=1 Tax=Tangfeifania diversioriginum TaxID=1168035 RepID=A0A1M6B2K3_9BACT|nr:YciI family protein [Tangfeifania diversioriginum]SHI42936.1 Uncharacterized conserved protein YciI, contains a putative active-site phosphohistidine [Tangfeifania diversioriginum]